jgi:putative addiction module CopG family antidote
MPETLPEDLQAFVDCEMASGRYQSREDIVIAGLRLLQRDRHEALAGIEEGLAEMKRGEGIPLDQAFDEIRRRHGIASEE